MIETYVPARLLVLAAILAALVGCGGCSPEKQHHPGWQIHSRVVFLSADLATPRAALPLDRFRVQFPYIAGDLYGAATTGDFFHPRIGPDYGFQIDLDEAHEHLLRSLQPTEFSLPYLRIDPVDARIARLAPIALQADGIERVGEANWVDPSSGERLLLVYVDRPARITGSTVTRTETVSYELRTASAGYVWVARREQPGGSVYTVIPRPRQVILAITPDAEVVTHK